MTTVIRTADEVTPAWLTDTLRAAGALPAGAVIGLTVAGNPAFNSAITNPILTYSDDAPAAAPRRLLLKRNLDAEWARRAGAREVAFYRFVAPSADELPMIVRCYSAAHDEATGDSHLLLRDLSATHAPPLTRDQILAGESVPALQHQHAVIDALARFHAFWWEHAALGSGVAAVNEWCRDADHYGRYVEQLHGQWDRFIAAEGDWFPSDLRTLYEQALSALPLLWRRSIAPRIGSLHNMTVAHGDSYFSNWLCPRAGSTGDACLVDFQSVGTDFGACDLVNMLATFWTPGQRRDGGREEAALRRYHETLRAAGVTGYTWHDLLADYRFALMDWIFVPVWDQTNGSSRSYWWPKLRNLTAAYQAWRCADLVADLR